MDSNFTSLFETPLGSRIYASACNTVAKYGMAPLMEEGALVGLSGGADSVMLLHFLLEYRRRTRDFPIIAVHINHMIRGDEADRDEEFCCNLCEGLNVEFISRRIDVPHLAKAQGIGTEECARNARYSTFADIISGRNDISVIVIAHNSTDNAETVVFNMLRGAGSRGAAGIPPVRDNVIRPLIGIKKADIVKALAECGIAYVTDSTNLSSDYTRNYIRNEILPTFSKISASPEDAIFRMSSNLRSDDDCLRALARDFIASSREGKITCRGLSALHESVLARVIAIMCDDAGVTVSHAAIIAIRGLLDSDNFTYTLPGGAKFIAEYGVCRIDAVSPNVIDYCFEIGEGLNELSGFDSDFFLTKGKLDKSSLNVYKISIQVNLRSAIINGRLFLRPRAEGDTVYYGGMTHKLKKMFNDRKIPPALRSCVPVLCDGKGVVWVPGFGVRDDRRDNSGEDLYCALCIGKGALFSRNRMYSASEFIK